MKRTISTTVTDFKGSNSKQSFILFLSEQDENLLLGYLIITT